MKGLMKSAAASLAGFVAMVLLISAIGPKTDFDAVKVDGGQVSGTTTANDIHVFKGIPFAAPPIGDLRWKEPQPVPPWTGVRKCEAFGPSPMQGNPAPFGPWSEEYLIPKEPISEDCLYLNVWTGARNKGEKRPVLVWIYGGGFVSGGGGVPVYDGEAMARKGIVFVSINYRVGVFGFFAHPELTKESSHGASGNYALMDQIAALNWVKKNIAAFGGDPGKVTIAGQSAGSMSVNALVASPLAKGLFHRAIAQSGAGFLSPTWIVSLQQAEQAGVKIMTDAKAVSIQELRRMPAADLAKLPRSLARPIVDGYVLPLSITETFSKGKQNNVPVLTGWNEDDGVVIGNFKTADEFRKQVQEQYKENSNDVLSFYPASNDEEAARSQAKLSRDVVFGAQNLSWARMQSDAGKSKIFVYRFTRKLPATGEYIRYGAFHTGEVAYAYDNLDFVKRCPWEPVDQQLATTMSSYWANFARNGDPNGKGLAPWPAFSTTDNMIMMLGEVCESKPLPDRSSLDALISVMK